MKKYNTYNFIFLLFAICTQNVFGQNTPFEKEYFPNNKDELKEAVRDLKDGDKLYEQGEIMYNKALEFFLLANAFNPNNAELNMKIGNCILHSNKRTEALPYFEKAYELDPNTNEMLNYYLGLSYQINHNWDKAIEHFKKYQLGLSGSDAAKRSELTEKKVQECKTALELVKKPVRAFIDNLGDAINTEYPDYGPVISADESVMMFTTRRPNGEKDQALDQDLKYFEDIYISYNNDGVWSKAQSIGHPINTPGHDATIGLSPDGQKLLIYVDDKGDGNIYVCTLEGDSWSEPQKMDKSINSSFHESSASFSPDGRTLFFTSNRLNNNQGMHDIYKVTMDDNGKWGKAENLGPTINTPLREYSIFMHPDGKTLYFSSEGHNTMGGFDIFKTVYNEGKWSEPVNIGYPINSPDDDIDFVLSADGKHAYVSSVKGNGRGEKDIYLITFLGPEKAPMLSNEDRLLASANVTIKEVEVAPTVEVARAQLTILKGTIYDSKTKQPLAATIELVDNTKNKIIASFKSNSSSGKYLVSLPSGKNYGIAVKCDEYLFHSENFDIPDSAAFQEIVKDIALNKLDVGSKIVLNNIFFDFNRATLRPESATEIERIVTLMNEIPSLKIEISGHTDNIGTAAYNQTLSENRAKAVVDYLAEKGVPKNRMTFKGYGFTQSVASNDTEEGRQQNRRTEFKIISK